jgi:hypothetical protein
MISLLIISVIAGAAVSSFTGIGFLFWLAGGFVFVCGLPFAAATSFVYDAVSYAQDRADYRQAMADIGAAELADEHEFAEDDRADRLAAAVKETHKPTVTFDNRQIHFHGRGE